MAIYDGEFQNIEQELGGILNGQIENGYERLREMYETGMIDSSMYSSVIEDLDRMVGRQYN